MTNTSRATKITTHLTIHENLLHHIFARPDKLALVYEDRSFTFAELYQCACNIARGLDSNGVRRGDRVGIHARNHWSYIPIFYAIAMIGAVSVPINYMLTEDQLGSLLKLTECKLLFTEIHYSPTMTRASSDGAMICCVDGDGEPGMSSLSDWLKTDAGPFNLDDPTSLYEPMMILFSSGTTGLPKGITLTHLNRILYFFALGSEYDIRDKDVSLCVTPLYHNAAIFFTFTNLYFGSTTVLHRQFSVNSTLLDIETYRVTNSFLVPTQIHQLAKDDSFRNRDTSSWRTVVSGAAPIPQITKETFLKNFPHVALHEMYGLTETGPIANLRPADQLRKLRSAGQAFLNVSFKIVDSSGTPVQTGEIGEIITKSPTLFDGYFRNPEATLHALKGGWFHTGDLGRIDDEGFLYVVDRAKDMIVVGGVNIYPKDIEAVICGFAEVDDVAVIGIPSKRWGESVHAIIVCKESVKLETREIISRCRERLARFQVPRSVEFRSVLPRNPSGKLLKRELRAEYWDGDHI